MSVSSILHLLLPNKLKYCDVTLTALKKHIQPHQTSPQGKANTAHSAIQQYPLDFICQDRLGQRSIIFRNVNTIILGIVVCVLVGTTISIARLTYVDHVYQCTIVIARHDMWTLVDLSEFIAVSFASKMPLQICSTFRLDQSEQNSTSLLTYTVQYCVLRRN